MTHCIRLSLHIRILLSTDIGTLAAHGTAFCLVGLADTVTQALTPFSCEIHNVHLLHLAASRIFQASYLC